MEDKSVQVGIRCEASVVEALAAYAKAHDLTLSQVVRRALREYVEREKKHGA